MGSKAKIIIPLIGLGIAAAATGGFGLAGAQAAGSAAAGGAAATTTGASALATQAAAEATIGLEAFGGTGALTGADLVAANAANVLGLAPAFPPAIPVPVTAIDALAGVGSQTASQGFFASLSADFAKMSTLEKVGLGFKGTSAVSSIAGSISNANAQKTAIAFQEAERKKVEARDRLDLTEKALDNEKRLRRVLAAQQVAAASSGVLASPGLADAAFGEAKTQSDILGNRRALLDEEGGVASGAFSLRRRLAANRGVGQGLGTLIDFGDTLTSRIGRSRRVA